MWIERQFPEKEQDRDAITGEASMRYFPGDHDK